MNNTTKSVLFICADQWRWDYFGFMKHKNAITPNLDKLAKDSCVFKSHFTGIVPCGPARATMLTGLYPFIHRSIRNGAPLDKRFTNIAKEVRKSGYDPKLFGYTDTTWDPRFLNNDDKKKWKSQETTDEWKQQNIIEIQKRLNGWQLESFKESYKNKLENGISIYKKENLK